MKLWLFALLMLTSLSALSQDGEISNNPASPDKIQKIVDVYFTSQLSDKDLSKAVDTITNQYVTSIDPNNKDWNPRNSKWDVIQKRVAKDLSPAIAQSIHDLKFRLKDDLTQSLKSQLTEADADTMIAFNKSSNGKAYNDFENQLNAICASSLAKMPDVQSGKIKVDLTQNKEAMKSRIRLVAMSSSIKAIQKKYSSGDGADNSGSFALVVMVQLVSVLGASDLDHLAGQYARSLDEFEKASNSPSQQKMAEVYAGMIEDSSKAFLQINTELDVAKDDHFFEWMELYAKSK